MTSSKHAAIMQSQLTEQGRLIMSLVDALRNFENDDKRVPKKIWAARNEALEKARKMGWQ